MSAAAEMGDYARSLGPPQLRAYALAYAEFLVGLRGDRPEGSTGPRVRIDAEREIRRHLRRIQADCSVSGYVVIVADGEIAPGGTPAEAVGPFSTEDAAAGWAMRETRYLVRVLPLAVREPDGAPPAVEEAHQ